MQLGHSNELSKVSLKGSQTVLLQVKGFINEAHFLPHAGLALPVWLPEPSPTSNKGSGGTSHTDAWRDDQKSWGCLLAEHIWQENLLAFDFRRNSVEACQNAGCTRPQHQQFI